MEAIPEFGYVTVGESRENPQLISPNGQIVAQVKKEPVSSAQPWDFFKLLSSLELSDAKVYEPHMQALLGTTSNFSKLDRFVPRTQSVNVRIVQRLASE